VTLIDTSAWIEFFRAKGDLQIKTLVRDFLLIKEAAYTCPVAFELTTGARKHEVADLRTGLGLAHRIVLKPEHWDAAAESNATLKSMGINLPASDLLIATVAHLGGFSLLAKDAHFKVIREHVLPDLSLHHSP
jgi:predicted nucleic acid-binding protein